jgi:hypothetical protein
MTCAVNPNTLSFTTTDPQTIAVSITSQGSSASGKQQARNYDNRGPLLGGVLLFPLFAIGSKKRRKAILLTLAMLAILAFVSCGGGGGSSGGTPPPVTPPLSGTSKGTYPLTVTATPDAGGATVLTLFVTVQ